MKLQVWHDESALRVGGIQASSIGYWLTSDTSKPLPSSFTLLLNARVFGAQVGTVTISPVKNGSFTMPLLAKVGGTVSGKIDDWQAYDKAGKPIDNSKDRKWATAASVGFTITGIADVTLTAKTIASLIPGIGFLAKAALATLGNKVHISVAHRKVVVHLPHGAG